MKLGYYCLFIDRLVKYKDKSKSEIKKVMLLRGTKVDFIENINEQDELEQKEEESTENNCFFFT